MAQPLIFQVLSLGDIDEVYGFAEARLRTAIPDETERRFASWEVPWRKEALEHYLKLGWSFIARRDGRAVGFFLGQPFLFYRGQTQTLWVEHVEADSKETADALTEVAVKVAREKHFQRALFADAGNLDLEKWAPQPMHDKIAEVKTTGRTSKG